MFTPSDVIPHTAGFGVTQANDLWLTPSIVDECQELGVTVRRVGSDSDTDYVFASTLDLAARVYGKPREVLRAAADSYSRIYVACRDDCIVGTITGTYARDGRLSTEEFLPASLVALHRNVVCSAYRLAVDPAGHNRSGGVARLLMRACFADALGNGMRLVVVTARPEMATYYHRVGFLALRNTRFVHPRLGAEHVAFAFPMESGRRTLFTDICQGLSNPMPLSVLDDFLEIPK